MSVEDAGKGVRAFPSAQEITGLGIALGQEFAVKVRAPLDGLSDAQRAFGDERFGGGTIDKAIAGVDGVFKAGDVAVAFHGDGDAALCVVGVRLAERLLGYDENIAVAGQFDGGAKAGDASAHDEEINDQKISGGGFRHNL